MRVKRVREILKKTTFNLKAIAVLLVSYAIVTFSVFRGGNSWGGAKADYENFYLPLIYFFSDNARLPNIEDYGLGTFPVWPILGGIILRIFDSEIAVILFQIVVGFISTCLVYVLSLQLRYSKHNAMFYSLAFSSCIYVASGSLNATTDVPSYCFILVCLIMITRSETHEIKQREYAILTISLFLLIGIRQLFLWFVVIIYLFEFKRLGIATFTRNYWISIVSNTLITLYFMNYFNWRIVPNSFASVAKLSFPSIVNLGIVSFISVLFLLPFFYFQLTSLVKSKTFTLSSIALLVLQVVFMRSALIPISQLSNYQYGWTEIWLKFGDFGFIFPAISNAIFFGYLLFCLKSKYLNDLTKLYFLGLIGSALIISQPFTRYFEIPLLIGVILLLRDSKLVIAPKYFNICIFYIFVFEVTKTVVTVF